MAENLLLVSSYHTEYPWSAGCERGLRAELGERYTLEVAYLDSKRLASKDYETRADQVWEALVASPPALVLLADDNALRLLGPRLAKTHIPVVYLGINNNPRDYFDQGMPENLTGVLERIPLFQSFRFTRLLLPEAKEGLILFDQSATSDALIEQTFGLNEGGIVAGIRATYRSTSDWAEWQQILESADEYDFVLIATYFSLKDEGGAPISSEAVMRWSSEHTQVPVFATQGFAVFDQGAVGALLIDPDRHGQQAGLLVREILEQGVAPSLIHPRTDREGVFMLNRRQLQRFNLEVSETLAPSVHYQE